MTGHCSHDTWSLKIAFLISVPVSPLLTPHMECKIRATPFLSGNHIALLHSPCLLIPISCVKLLETAFTAALGRTTSDAAVLDLMWEKSKLV